LGGTIAALLVVTTGIGTWAAQPPGDSTLTSVVFRSTLSETQIRDRLALVGASVVWQDEARSMAVVDMPVGGGWRLYRKGALLVTGAGLPAGCFSWSRV
jgi:hypothetical protein